MAYIEDKIFIEIKDKMFCYKSYEYDLWVVHSLNFDQVGMGHTQEAINECIAAVKALILLFIEEGVPFNKMYRPAPDEIQQKAEIAQKFNDEERYGYVKTYIYTEHEL